MLVELRDILRKPGTLSFNFELDLSDAKLDAVMRWNSPTLVTGEVRNGADLLTMRCTVTADAHMTCDRCGREFDRLIKRDFEAILSDELTNPDDSDVFPFKGSSVDMGEIVRTLFILDMPTLSLCRDDCEFPSTEI
jgi:uncharacterized protein